MKQNYLFLTKCLICVIAFAPLGIIKAENDTVSSTFFRDMNFPDLDHTEKFLYNNFIKNCFDIGIRTASSSFSRSKEKENLNPDQDFWFEGEKYIEGYFIGSTDELHEDQVNGTGLHNLQISWFPLGAIRNWPILDDTRKEVPKTISKIAEYILSNIGMEFAWSELHGITFTSEELDNAGNYLDGGYSDGTVVAKGDIITAIARFPFEIRNIRFVPYIGVGSARFGSPDVTQEWWHFGFGGETWREADAAYNEWRAAGSQDNPNSGYRRTFTVGRDNGNIFMYGIAVKLYENWQIDFYYRETKNLVFGNTYRIGVSSDIIASADDAVFQTRYSKWDLSNKTMGLGMRYSF
ncbi:hypothetical protein ACFLS1_09430 [Verrucomicrobiota bacterium]